MKKLVLLKNITKKTFLYLAVSKLTTFFIYAEALPDTKDQMTTLTCESIFKGSDVFKKVFGSFDITFLKTCESFYTPLTLAQIVFGFISILPFFLIVLVIINILRGAFKMIRSEGNERDMIAGRKMVINSVIGLILLILYFMFVINLASILIFGEPYMVIFDKIVTFLKDGVLA